MRINKFISQALPTSRRKAEEFITRGQIKLNEKIAILTDRVGEFDRVYLNDQELKLSTTEDFVIILNKPLGYVCTHSAQGWDPTIFELLPAEFGNLKIAGRLDKDTTGLVLLTNNGDFAHSVTHPKFGKNKVYTAKLKFALNERELSLIQTEGVDIGDDRLSKFLIEKLPDSSYKLTLREGRNRQIRRTFKALGNEVTSLHRLSLGEYELGELGSGKWFKIAT